MNPVLIDRERLTKAVASIPKAKLAVMFGISLPTLRSYINGAEPVTSAISEKINFILQQMGEKK